MFSFFKKKEPEPPQQSQKLKDHEKELFRLIEVKDFDLFKQIMEGEHVDPNLKSHFSRTLLLHTAGDDHKYVFTEYLVNNGADINAIGEKGFTAVFLAAYYNRKKTLKLLLSKRPNNIDKENIAFGFDLNPVTATVFKDFYEIGKMLMYAGADPYKAEKIMLSNEKIFKELYSQKYKELLEFYKRWHKGKKQFLLAFYFSKNRTDEQQAVKGLKPFDLNLLPDEVVIRIADEFL